MNEKIEELVESIRENSDIWSQEFFPHRIEKLLVSFAREMCDRQRRICAYNAKIGKDESDVWVDKLSIINAHYPEELQ